MGKLIKIREMTSQYGISARALKYYEEMGLISSTRNDDYAYRLYDDAAAQRLEQILVLRKLNISIKDIQRIFNTAGSDVVLEVLGKKVDAIDEEVSLLHELKEIVLDFIHHIEQSDFGKESDIKLLYEKAKKLETQLENTDYNGNTANVNRLIDVTEKLAKTPEIIQKNSHCYLIFNLKDKNSVIEACKLYCEAFGAEKTSEDTSASDWIADWIGINIRVFNFGVFLQSVDMPSNRGACCISFSTEQGLRKAYDLLSKKAEESNLHLDWHWTPLAAVVKDKF
ncbi:MAG: MerR family transcriptional regulator, partial [Defluviitaleaceae bacterium]|nr:MerR family transcriptional regulator [Defluviitaleaceae bacterium]